MVSEPTNEQVLEALEQSGYLFEQEVADAMEKLGLHVDTSWAFPDPELDKSRELDIHGIRRVLHDEPNRFSVFVEILAECKSFEAPLVFLQRPKNERELTRAIPREYIFPMQHYRKQVGQNSYQEVPPFIHLELSQHHYYYRESVKATQFAKVVRKGDKWVANHDGVYDSLVLPLAKALEYRRRDIDKIAHRADWRYVWLFFPVVVLRDALLTIDLAAPMRQITPRDRVSFVRHLESGNVKGFYLIDFISSAHLRKYIGEELQKFVDHIGQIYATKPDTLLNDA